MRILITGGAGFVGSRLARLFRAHAPEHQIVVFDNLRRRGSEKNAARFDHEGIEFVHGDIRSTSDLHSLPYSTFDLLIEASAEPSVHAGSEGSPEYVVETNLTGTFNCLEYARRRAGAFFFLSTSRVYSISALREIALSESPTRFVLQEGSQPAGVSKLGISESFSIASARSFYGTTKLASELLIQEYVHSYRMRAMINRCGVICGAGQFGKPDQGVFTLWMMRHFAEQRLTYTGFGGTGKQVRDLLAPEDLFALVLKQLDAPRDTWGVPFNIGGGSPNSVSLQEVTQLCRELTGKHIPVNPRPETASNDVPWFVTDSSLARETFDWSPKISVKTMLTSVRDWLASESHRTSEAA